MKNITETLQFILLKHYSKRKKYCSKECEKIGPVCDFCKYYNYNGEDLYRDGKTYKGAIYTGEGWCDYWKDWKDPSDGCEKFICEFIKKKEKNTILTKESLQDDPMLNELWDNDKDACYDEE